MQNGWDTLQKDGLLYGHLDKGLYNLTNQIERICFEELPLHQAVQK